MQTSSVSPAQAAAARELLRRRRGRASLIGYANAIEIPGKPAEDDPEAWLFKPVETAVAAHHALLLSAIERTAARRRGRLMVFMPPGSAKSTYCSVVAPSWLMGRQPDMRIILASYGSDLARRHGRRARQVAKSPGFASLFGCSLSPSTSAADEWALTNGSEYLAGGILSGITGNRAHGLFIDDPVKGREQADSPTIRAKTWDAYNDDLLTRLIPGGFVVLVQCMVGETPVRMADGSDKQLRDVRPGDLIATYDAGVIGVSSITNWKSSGPDSVYRIKTSSGASVKANSRHPFLVRKGSEERWVRLKDLAAGDRILRAIGESGEASSAQARGAEKTRELEVSAHRTTTKRDGLKGFARRLLERIRRLASARSSSIDTASPSTTTSGFSPSRGAPVQYAGDRQARPGILSTGTTFFASITATIRERFAACCATTATSQSGEARPPKCSKPLPSTFAVIPDEIVSIEYVGEEEVFDVEVERTANFLADGLVSHNTRWHEDDLAGRILPKNYDGRSGIVRGTDGELWEIINLPAQCERADDPLGRPIGGYLWPEWFDEAHWQTFKLQSRTWAALFQQRPRPDEGGVFKEAWCRNRYGVLPIGASSIVHSWDTAQKENEFNDPTAMSSWGMGPGVPGYYLRDVYRERIDYPTLRRKVIAWAERDRPIAILIEDKSSGQSLIQDLRNSTSLPIVPIEPDGSKLFRAGEVSAMVESGLVHLPESAPWLVDFEGEFFGFPLSTNDDQVDSVTQFLKWAAGWSGRIESHGAGLTREIAASHLHREDKVEGYGSVGRGESMDGFN